MPSPLLPDTPNILLLFVDQMRFDAMGCAGNGEVRTPNLDRMAEQGLRFTRGYTPVPVCIAARHSLLQGHRCATHGRSGNNVPLPEPLLYTLPQLLGSAGYHTQAIGKMHFRPVRRHFGFHRMQLMEEIPDFRQDDEYLLYLKANGYGHKREVHGVRNLLYMHPQTSVIPEEHHGSTWVADRTIDFLIENRDRPFFCWSSWIAPHPPWNVPEPFASLHSADEMSLPVDGDRDPETLPLVMRRLRRLLPHHNPSHRLLQRIRALYYGNIALIDKGVGRILRALDELGLSERTLVIFTSDHGELLGDHGAWQKSNPYEPSVHVPFMMRMPGTVESNAERDELVSLLDIMPTALELADVDYPGQPSLPGASLLGRPGGGLSTPRDELVIEIGQERSRWLSLLRGSWKYTYYLDNGWEELYDMERDPREERNRLLGRPAADDRRRADEMKAALTLWEREHGFPTSLTNAGELRNFETPMQEPDEVWSNLQFPRWVPRLLDAERALMESRGDVVRNAMAREDTYALDDLPHLQAWLDGGGSLE